MSKLYSTIEDNANIRGTYVIICVINFETTTMKLSYFYLYWNLWKLTLSIPIINSWTLKYGFLWDMFSFLRIFADELHIPLSIK